MHVLKELWGDEAGWEIAEKAVFAVFGATLAVGAMMQIAPRFKDAVTRMTNALQ